MNDIKRLFLLLLIFLTSVLLAHTPLLLVEDNGDGTLYAEAGFSDGSGAQGMACRLEDEDGNILWEGQFDDFSSVEVEIPDVSKYYVVLDAGPGHIVKKEGPVKVALAEEVSVETGEQDNEKSVEKSVEQVQQAQTTTAQPIAYNTSPMSYYPVREYSSDNNNFSELKSQMTLITVFLGIIGLCMIFMTVALIVLVSNKKN